MAVAGMAALVVLKFVTPSSPAQIATPPAAAAALSSASRTASAAPSMREADALLHAWFAAKVEATGPAYRAAALQGVLAGTQLRKWSDVVAQLRRDGRWAYIYPMAAMQFELLAAMHACGLA